MQQANDSNSVIGNSKIDDVSSHPATAVAFSNVIARCPKLRTVGELVEGGRQFVVVTIGMFQTPFFQRLKPNGFKVALRFRC